jgi:hypothetical protein
MSGVHRERNRGGRPTKWSPALAARLADLVGGELRTRRAAAVEIGVGYQTLMDWQRQNPKWTAEVRKLRAETLGRRKAQALAARQAARLLRRSRRPLPGSKPTKQMKLVCWYLTHCVRLRNALCKEDERQACSRFNMAFSKWEQAKRRFPCLMEQVHDRRGRRLAYLHVHGEIIPGWTPPRGCR